MCTACAHGRCRPRPVVRPGAGLRACALVGGALLSVACGAKVARPPAGVPGAVADAGARKQARTRSRPGAEPAPPPLLSPAEPEALHLPGGGTVLLVENHATRTVALELWLHSGAADEPEDQLGINHLAERLLLYEQASEPVQRILGAGSEVASWTAHDHTVFHARVPGPRWPVAVDLLRALLAPPRFDDAAVVRQRQVVLAELSQASAPAQPPSLAAPGLVEALFARAFERHPYRRPPLGRTETAARLTPAQVLAHCQRTLLAAPRTLVIVGDFDAAALRARLAALPAPGERTPRPPRLEERPAEPAQDAPRVAVLPLQGSGGGDARAQVLLGFRVPAATRPGDAATELAAVSVAAVLLGGHEDAHGPREPARPRSLDATTDVVAHSFTGRDPGLLWVGAATSGPPEDAARALLHEALRLGRREVGARSLERAQRALLTDAAYQRETPAGLARRLGFFASLGLRESLFDERLRALTPRQLHAVLSRHLVPGNLTLLVLQPPATKASRPPETEAGLRALVAAASAGQPVAPRPLDAAGQAAGRTEYTLSGGAHLVVTPDHSAPVVAVAALWPGGPRLEDERSAGLHQLLGRVWPRATRARGPEALTRELESLGGSLRAVVDPDAFGLRGEFLSSAQASGLALVAECLQNPSFSEAEVERERRTLVQELRGLEGEGAPAAVRLFKQTLLGSHPYQLEPLPQAVAMLSRRRLVEHFRRAYPVSRLTLAVVGDVDPAEVAEQLEALLGQGPASPAPPPVPPPAPPASASQQIRYLPSQSAHAVLGFPGPSLADPDRYALEVLIEMLAAPVPAPADGAAGLLARTLRDRRGLAFAVQPLLRIGALPGFVAFHLTTTPQNLEAAEAGLRDELRRVVDHAPGTAELERARDRLLSRFARLHERFADRAAGLALDRVLGLRGASEDGYTPGLLAVDAAAVQRAARRFLGDGSAVLAAVLPEQLAPSLRRPLEPPAALAQPEKEKTPERADKHGPPAQPARPASAKLAQKDLGRGRHKEPAKPARGATASKHVPAKHAAAGRSKG